MTFEEWFASLQGSYFKAPPHPCIKDLTFMAYQAGQASARELVTKMIKQLAKSSSYLEYIAETDKQAMRISDKNIKLIAEADKFLGGKDGKKY